MKKSIFILLFLPVILFCSCSGKDVHEKVGDNEDDAIVYEFSGEEIVVVLKKNKPLGSAPEYDGVLLVYADGRVEAGIVKFIDVLYDKAFDKSINEYLLDHKELTRLEEKQIEEICSLTQNINMECGWEGEARAELPDVVVSDKYSYYCIQWTENGGESLRVISGDDRAGTTSRALDENAISAVDLVFDGEYRKDWYEYINEYFGKDGE